MYLAACCCAALLAWGLGWARTYILALVSERIAPIAHHHLRAPAALSLDYFGSKRTGDLMARIGSKPTASTFSSRCALISSPTC